MTTATSLRQPELTRQTVALIGGGADIVVETARQAHAESAGIVLTGCGPSPWSGLRPACPEKIDHVMARAAGPVFH